MRGGGFDGIKAARTHRARCIIKKKCLQRALDNRERGVNFVAKRGPETKDFDEIFSLYFFSIVLFRVSLAQKERGIYVCLFCGMVFGFLFSPMWSQ